VRIDASYDRYRYEPRGNTRSEIISTPLSQEVANVTPLRQSQNALQPSPIEIPVGKHHLGQEVLSDFQHDLDRWGRRIFLCKTADSLLNIFLTLPFQTIKNLKKIISVNSALLHNWGKSTVFPEPTQYEEVFGWDMVGKTPKQFHIEGKNPFLLSTAKSEVLQNLSGFKAAHLERQKLGGALKGAQKILLEGNAESIFAPLTKNGVFSFLGGVFASVMVLVGVAQKTVLALDRQLILEKSGQQNRLKTLEKTGLAFVQEGGIGILAWEAATIGSRFAKALLFVLPQNKALDTIATLASSIIIGSAFGSVTEQAARKAFNRH
jgi:hypothetical protein